MDNRRKLLVGVDEAGYGPNLGPLVVVAAWLEVPAETRSDQLWQLLAPTITRQGGESACDALVIDDSKRVYSAGDRAEGLGRLERAALAWLSLCGPPPSSLRHLWHHCSLTPIHDLDEGPCYAGQELRLPHRTEPQRVEQDQPGLSCALARAGFGSAGLACQIVLPRRFNELVRHGNKAEALFQLNAELLRYIWENSGAATIEVTLDKHGGRNFYAPLLQREFMETVVWAGREGARASHYTIAVGDRRLNATFLPEADQQHLLVAVASMTAKYVRELCMDLFNSFWSNLIPGLTPTAGYPGDSHRFWKLIEPVSDQLGIERELLWRDR